MIRTHNQTQCHVPRGSILNTEIITQYLTFPPKTLHVRKLKQKSTFHISYLLNILGLDGVFK